MGQYHGSARTVAAVHRAIQHSQESLNQLAERYDLNPKTVAKWQKRTQASRAKSAAFYRADDRTGSNYCGVS